MNHTEGEQNIPQIMQSIGIGPGKKQFGSILISIGIAAMILFLFFRFLWNPILPFLLGGLLAAVLQKPLDFLDRICGKRKKLRCVWAFVLVFGCVALILTLIFCITNVLLGECGTFFNWLGDNIDTIGTSFSRMTEQLEQFLQSLPFLDHAKGSTRAVPSETEDNILVSFLLSVDDILIHTMQKTVSAVTAKIPAFLTAVAAALPKILLFLGVFLLAAVYMTIEYHEIGAFLKKKCPQKTTALLSGLRLSLLSTVWLYLRAYIILCLITFAELYAGFAILGIHWAFGAAALGALIDLLPVFGTGTLLLPWAIFELIRGGWYRGIGLVVLYLIICTVRQILEPKIIGKSIGLHPLAALFFMYTGIKLFGLAGLFLFPMTAAVVWKYFESRSKVERKKGKEGG